ncbi:MAG: glycosyltransferase family 4 protein [Candidatus Magasanikbacteria bacterium]
MKILYLITKSEEGGAQTHVLQLSRYFISQGHEVVVMSYPSGWLENEIKKIGGKFFANNYFSNSFNPFNLLNSIKKIQTVVSDFKPDVVHCHSSMAGFLGRLAVQNRVPTLYTAHGWGFNIGVPFIQKQLAIIGEKLAAKYCIKIICVSKFVKDLALKYHIAKEDKFDVVYNGVETDCQLVNKTDDKIKIVFVGRLALPKQPLMLLQTIKNLPDNLKINLEVSIVGTGPLKTELENFIKNNQMNEVKMLGSLTRENVLRVLCQSDIFVLLSQWEGLPLSVLEAMSVGLPVIASDVGGLNEIINSKNGFLIKNSERLPVVLEDLIKNKDLRKQIGDSARLSIIENYSVDKMLSETQKIYNEVTKK